MTNITSESVGEGFSDQALQRARDKTLEVILEAAKQIKAGTSESEARNLVSHIQSQKGAPKSWHPSQIRFGENTIHPFGVRGSEGVALQTNDIYFLDIGPIFEGHEGDVGRSFTVGDDPEMIRCCQDVETVWREVRDHWYQQKVSGIELYRFAEICAKKRGWILSLQKANGHRIADFPHSAGKRGSIEGFSEVPTANRWILEIQIRHPEKTFGAFYEDLLS